jgi:hypothetical protein
LLPLKAVVRSPLTLRHIKDAPNQFIGVLDDRAFTNRDVEGFNENLAAVEPEMLNGHQDIRYKVVDVNARRNRDDPMQNNLSARIAPRETSSQLNSRPSIPP